MNSPKTLVFSCVYPVELCKIDEVQRFYRLISIIFLWIKFACEILAKKLYEVIIFHKELEEIGFLLLDCSYFARACKRWNFIFIFDLKKSGVNWSIFEIMLMIHMAVK